MNDGWSGRPRTIWGRLPWRTLLFLIVLGGVVRGFFCAVLRVPTGSMEPTLHGDPVRGDEMLVFTPWFKITRPDRFELAVFERNDEDTTGERMNVKRIVGLPGESIRIDDGDVFITAAGSNREMRVERTYSEFRPRLVRRFVEHFGLQFTSDFRVEDTNRVVVDGRGVVFHGGGRAEDQAQVSLEPKIAQVDDGWLDANGMDHPGDELVDDVLIAFEITPTAETTCYAFDMSIGMCQYHFDIVPRSSANAVLLRRKHEDTGVVEPDQSQQIPLLDPQKRHFLEFFHIDGQAGLAIDGSDEFCVSLSGGGSAVGAGSRGLRDVSFGLFGGDARLTRFEIWRDVHYTEPSDSTYARHNASYKIPDDSVFVLGDASGESVDSRYFGAVPLKNLRGRPFLIVGPSRRIGLLH